MPPHLQALCCCLQARFHNKIAQLTYTFPEDAKTSTGALFWSPPKRFPRVVEFDPADPAHRAYLQASAILFAEVYGVERPPWAEDAAEVASKAAAVPVRPARAACCDATFALFH